MKTIIVILGLLITSFFELNFNSNEDCKILTGLYKLDNEVWELSINSDSKDEFFIFRCTNRGCNAQTTFMWNACHLESDNTVILCHIDDDNEQLVFSNCDGNTCSNINQEYYSHVTFLERGEKAREGDFICE